MSVKEPELSAGRIVFVNRYFFPDESATSQLLTDLACHLSEIGHEVIVVTSRQRLDDPSAALARAGRHSGVEIRRIPTTTFGRETHLGRAVDFLTFYMSAVVGLSRLLRRGDILVVKTDPPLMTVIGGLIARAKRVPVINWWQDIYPEIASRLGVPILGSSMVEALLAGIRNWSARSAALNVVIGRCMGEFLISQSVPESRIKVISNWVDDESITPVSRHSNSLRDAWNLGERFVVGYSGNIGRGHQFSLLLRAAEILRGEKEIVFLFIGQGAKLEALKNEVEQRALTNVHFRPFQPRQQLGLSLTVPDAHVVSLDPGLQGLIVPSKFYGALAAGRPVIFLGPPASEIARVIAEAECGLVEAGPDPEGLVQFIRENARDAGLRDRLGSNARQAIDSQFSAAKSLEKWSSVVGRLM